MPISHVEITKNPLSLDAAATIVGHSATGESPGTDPEAGALVMFSGVVRETEGDDKIPRLDYEHYAGMAEKEMEKLIDRAREKWPLHDVALIHRIGPVAVGESSVIIAVSAGHRPEAFEAARFLIDELKKSVPIWKAAPGG